MWLKSDLAAHPDQLHARLLAPPALELGRPRQRRVDARLLDRPLQRPRRHRPERPRQPPLRALHAPEPRPATPDAQRRSASSSSAPAASRTAPRRRRRGDSDHDSRSRDYTSFGVLKLTLHPSSYDWQFVPEVGGSFTDSGTAQLPLRASAQRAGGPVALGDRRRQHGAPLLDALRPTAARRSRATTSTGARPPGGETLLKSVGNVTSYDDNTVVNGTKYYYRVAAVNQRRRGGAVQRGTRTPAARRSADADRRSQVTAPCGCRGRPARRRLAHHRLQDLSRHQPPAACTLLKTRRQRHVIRRRRPVTNGTGLLLPGRRDQQRRPGIAVRARRRPPRRRCRQRRG